MHNFLSIAEGKLVNNGLQPDDKVKLDRLTPDTKGTPSFAFILENMGLHCCLEAMQAAPYSQENFTDKVMRLLTIDAAYRAMPFWEDSAHHAVLKKLLRSAHLYAHNEIKYYELQEHLWEAVESTNHAGLPATHAATNSVLNAASDTQISAIFAATEAVREHHGAIAKGTVYTIKVSKDEALGFAWDLGGPISFGAAYGVTSNRILAAAEHEIWHVAYTIADELLRLTTYENVEISEKTMADFVEEALEPTAKAIAEDILQKNVRHVISTTMTANSFDEICSLTQNAAQRVSRESDRDRELYERIAIGATALAATCHDFEDEETYIICDALRWFHEGSFIKDSPLNSKANEIAESVAKKARMRLCLEQIAYRAAASFAEKQETDIQANVLARLLCDLKDSAG